MEKISFSNKSQPGVNDTNLNKMQDNIEAYINESILSMKVELYSHIKELQENLEAQIIRKEYSSNVTVSANGNNVVNFGAIEVIDGYTAIGVINKDTGYGDQFSMSCGFYGGNIIGKVVNHFGSELTNTVSCSVIYLKN